MNMANYIQGSNIFTQQCLHEFRQKKRSMIGFSSARENNLKVNEEKSERKKLKILIAGGGIGGLSFALAAKSSGFEVKVLERDLTAVRGEGRHRGPIQLLSTALGLLQSIDKNVVRQIMEAGFATCHRSGLADGTTGQWLVKLDYGAPAVEKGIPVTLMICRIELQRILLNAVGDDIVISNSKVVDFVSDADKVTVLLENGEKHEGDILVGADGIRSMVRQKLFGGGAPKYSNFICYTGVAEYHPQYLPSFGHKIFVGTNQYFVAVEIGKGRMQWYAFVRWPSQTPIPSSGYKVFVLECFGDWCNEAITIVNRTAENMIIPRLMHDIDMSSVWGRGRVVLLGDAAHAMLPNLGQGGSMAIEDSYWLMLELRNLAEKKATVSQIPVEEIELAFKRFEKKRMFRVRTLHCVCRMASVMTSQYHTYIHIPPLPFFNVRLKHPAFVVSSMLLKLVFPKFMEWVVVGQD